jgi:hypothetical protein
VIWGREQRARSATNQHDGQIRRASHLGLQKTCQVTSNCLPFVIACGKRQAFAHGAMRRSNSECFREGYGATSATMEVCSLSPLVRDELLGWHSEASLRDTNCSRDAPPMTIAAKHSRPRTHKPDSATECPLFPKGDAVVAQQRNDAMGHEETHGGNAAVSSSPWPGANLLGRTKRKREVPAISASSVPS